jgi:hypothetical protein
MQKNKLSAKLAVIVGAGVAFLPLFVSAATSVGGNIDALLRLVENVIGRLIPIFVALALIYFIWGLIKFVIAADAEAREDGKKMMWWGIVALFVIVSIWGIVAFIGNILGIDPTTTVNTPRVGNLGSGS